MPGLDVDLMSPLRVIVVEDIAILAFDLVDLLRSAGHVVVGVACSLGDGLALACTAEADVAILDVDLGKLDSGPIADELARRGIPFVFATALDARDLPAGHQARLRVGKPYLPAHIARALATAVAPPACLPANPLRQAA